MIRIVDDTVLVETNTLVGKIRQGFLTSLRSKASGMELIEPFSLENGSALEVVYADGRNVGFSVGKLTKITYHTVSDHCVEIRLHGWDADGLIRISECPDTGALLVEPSAYSARSGVHACRWWLKGIPPSVDLVAPIHQGIRLPLSDNLISGSRWTWPITWEAGMAILQGANSGFWVHAQDTSYRYKALVVGKDGNTLAFDTEAYGPLDSSLGAGGLTWRINVYQGGWQTPAEEYRRWLWQAYGLQERAAARPAWFDQVSFAVSWCRTDPDFLDALAEKVEPARTLIHLPQWRVDGYDENYPNFSPSEAGKEFIAKGRAMGFHILPHCNAIDMDPSNPVYQYVRDFEYRDLIHKSRLGWSWDPELQVIGVPNSNVSLQENRKRKVMIKVHPGLSMWRSILAEHIKSGLAGLDVDSVFIDVTLCSHNLHNCLVENTTSTEGMKLLIDEVGAIGRGLVVAGEGLNEITTQSLCFAQAHLFRSHHTNYPGVERTGGCPLNAFLFNRLCRTFGYSALSGRTDADRLRSDIHLSLGAIPTITGLSAAEVRNPGPYVQKLFELAH